MRVRYKLSALAAIAAATMLISARSPYADCDPSGKTLNLIRTVCFEGGQQNGSCIYGPIKIKIIGRSVLYYSDPRDSIGVEYSLDGTKDLLTNADSLQRQELTRNAMVPNASLSISGGASFSQGILTIHSRKAYTSTIDMRIPNSTLAYRAGDLMVISDTSESFAIDASCLRCSVLSFGDETKMVGGPTIMRAKLGNNNSCSID
jgi:hypothetical protein